MRLWNFETMRSLACVFFFPYCYSALPYASQGVGEVSQTPVNGRILWILRTRARLPNPILREDGVPCLD